MIAGILLLELVALYILTRIVTQSLYAFFLLMVRSRSVAITTILLLYFPGTVIHELSHLFTAEILRVRTGKLTLVPETIRDSTITPGSVMIAQTDPLRRYAIGLAPLFSGMLLLLAISYYMPQLYASAFQSGMPLLQNPDFYWLLGVGYLTFAVANTMFSSPEDVKGIAPFAIVALIIGLLGYLLGLRFELTGQALAISTAVLHSLVKSLGIVLGINTVLLIVLSTAIRGISRLTKTRIVPSANNQ